MLGKECLRYWGGWLCFDQREKWGMAHSHKLLLPTLGRRRARRKVLASTICLYINSCVLHTEMSTVGCLNISLRFLHMEGRTGDSLQFAVGGEQLRFADG